MIIYWILMILLVVVACIITVNFARSKENKWESESRGYRNKAGVKMVKLSMYYVGVTIAIGAVLLFVYLYYK